MLEEERQFYERNLPQWLSSYAGRFVVVKGQSLVGVYNTIDEALAEGARHFGLNSFLVRQVQPTQPEVRIPALALGLLRADTTHPVHG